MEAINAVGLTPLSVLSERRAENRKRVAFSSISHLKNCPNLPYFGYNRGNIAETLPRSIQSGIVLLSSFLTSGLAKALTYEEALQQSVETPTIDIDASGFLDSFTNFVVENPLVIGGGAAVLAVPLVVSQFFGKSKPWGVESAKSAYAKLGEDAGAQLLDIRSSAEIRQMGSPDIKSLKKKVVNVPYTGEDKVGFLKKLSLKFKEPENTTLFILDKFDGSSELVAELVTANGFKAAYAVKDGAEGSRGWMNSGLPWILPKKTLDLGLSSLTDAIGGVFEEGSITASLGLGLAAATGLGLVAFTEVETILQVLGSAALVQLVSKKFLFAEDRKKTLAEVDEFLTKKIAPNELVDDIKQIGTALLPSPVTSKALPSPTEASPDTSVPETLAQANDAPAKVEAATPPAVPETVAQANDAPPKVEAVTPPAPEVNSVPKAEVEKESLPVTPRSLSPYPNYPDLRPPSSPMPSQP